MNRRQLLRTAPVAAIAAALTSGNTAEAAALALGETPVMRLFREWEVARAAYNAGEGDDETGWIPMKELEDQILVAPPQTVSDYAAKVVVLNDFASLDDGYWGQTMLAEARALVAA